MTSQGLIPGLNRIRVNVNGISIDALVGGTGEPLLLLHGYPQTRMIWEQVAPELSKHFTLVIPDLRGYGRSDKPNAEDSVALYSKREMAKDQVALMSYLGFDEFYIAGHDRGGRVSYRLALDYPEKVIRLAVLDIIPTSDQFELGPEANMGMFHWTFLAQPAPFPENILANQGDKFAAELMKKWALPNHSFTQNAWQDYMWSNAQADVVQACCNDYRAAWHIDRELDNQDKGHRKIQPPLLVINGSHDAISKLDLSSIWSQWSDNFVLAEANAGHFIPEESPEETASLLLSFFHGDN